MSQAEDLILVGQVSLLGSRRAFDTLVRKYQGDVRRLLMNLTGGDADLAADIAQDTFLKAWMYIGSYKATARFRTWLFSIAYNVFYDYAALQKKHAHRDLSDCEYYLTETDGSATEKNIDLYRALDTLRPAERTAVVMFYLEQMKQEEIARVMGVPLSTVKTHISRGKAHLAKILKR